MGKIVSGGQIQERLPLAAQKYPFSTFLFTNKMLIMVKQCALAKPKTKQNTHIPAFLATYMHKLKASKYHIHGINVHLIPSVQALNEKMHVKCFMQL